MQLNRMLISQQDVKGNGVPVAKNAMESDHDSTSVNFTRATITRYPVGARWHAMAASWFSTHAFRTRHYNYPIQLSYTIIRYVKSWANSLRLCLTRRAVSTKLTAKHRNDLPQIAKRRHANVGLINEIVLAVFRTLGSATGWTLFSVAKKALSKTDAWLIPSNNPIASVTKK